MNGSRRLRECPELQRAAVSVCLGVVVLVSSVCGQERAGDSGGNEIATVAARKKAIERGLEWLAGARTGSGLYRTLFGASGPTALALYAMASCGVKESDPGFRETVQKLAGLPVSRKGDMGDVAGGKPALRMTYDHALAVLAFAAIDAAKYEANIRRSVRALVKAQKKSGQWDYTVCTRGPLDAGDNSNTQFALLALRAAAGRGISVPRSVWARACRHFENTVGNDGGWGYGCRGVMDGSYGSMTASGVASLVMARAGLLGKDKASTHRYLEERAIQGGLAWLRKYTTAGEHPGIVSVKLRRAPRGYTGFKQRAFHYYWLYSMERVGGLLDLRGSADHRWYRDWYENAADWLVKNQETDGSWKNDHADTVAPESPLAATCFALLVLSRATTSLTVHMRPVSPRSNQARSRN